MTATQPGARRGRREPVSRSEYGTLIFLASLALGVLVVGIAAGAVLPVALVVGVCLGSVALLSPSTSVGLLALLVVTYWGTVIEQEYGVPSPVLPVALLVILVSRPWRLVRRDEHSPAIDALLLAGAYGVVLVASSLVASDFEAATAAMLRQGRAAFVMVAVAAYVSATRSVRPVVWGLIVGGLIVGAVVDHQTITKAFDNDYWGLAKAPVRQIAGADVRPRAAGPLGDPNFFAQSMVVVVALAFERLRNAKAPAQRVVAGLAVLAAGASVIFSFSRAGFAALVVVVALSVLARPRSRVLIAGTAAVVLLASPFVLRELGPRLANVGGVTELGAGQQPSDDSVSGRAAEMLAAVQMFADHPLLGVGVGNFNGRYPEYAVQRTLEQRRGERSAHSLPLEIAAETGLVGIGVFLVLVAIAYGRLRSAAAATRDGPRRDEGLMAHGIAVALAGFGVSALFLHGAYPELLWTLLGLGLASAALPGVERATRRHPRTV